MKDIRQLLKVKGLERIADVVQIATKRSIRLTATGSSEESHTRLGGRPNLPLQIEWPSWNGEPLAFLAQIDLTAAPVIDGFALPGEGSLFFFHAAGENAPWGFDPKEQGYAHVVYSPAALQNTELRSFPGDLGEERQYRGVALHLEPLEDSIPDTRDQVIEELGLTPDEELRYDEVWEEWNSKRPDLCHRVAGYPDRLQGDVRLEAHLVSHGLYCGNSGGYNEGKLKGLWPGAKDWELLFQIDSEDSAGMMWGDTGRIYYLIHKNDLQQRRFEKSWAILECL